MLNIKQNHLPQITELTNSLVVLKADTITKVIVNLFVIQFSDFLGQITHIMLATKYGREGKIEDYVFYAEKSGRLYCTVMYCTVYSAREMGTVQHNNHCLGLFVQEKNRN